MQEDGNGVADVQELKNGNDTKVTYAVRCVYVKSAAQENFCCFGDERQ